MNAFKTWRHAGMNYVAADRGDGWHVIREDGGNFGAWQTVEEFRKRQSVGHESAVNPLDGCKARLRVWVEACA